MKTPTHDAVAQRAHEIWENYGRPNGRDTEIWLEAERQLSADSDPNAGSTENGSETARLKAEMAAESVVENHISPAIPDDEAIKAALQKRDARAPMVPHHTGPKAKPPESGKPIWSKPHSS